MVYLQVNNSLSASFSSKGNLLNWLAHQGVYSVKSELKAGEWVEIWRKDDKIVNIQIVEYGTNDHMKIEEFLASL